ncbi:MAG: hypothetical protein IPN38_08345 [Flavobacteriales bacterium]|nr:hypothetical protein [Flavobacteriales bacterium]
MPRRLRGIHLLLTICSGTVLCAQANAQLPRWRMPIQARTVEPRIIAHGALTFQGPQLVSNELDHAAGVPWFGFEAGTGASFTVHDRWGVDVQGDFAYQSNMLWVDSVCFPIFLPNLRTEFRAWRLLPWPDWDEGELKITMAAGCDFQSGGEKSRDDDQYHTTTRYDALTRAFIAPELGLWYYDDASDRHEFAVRWVHHLDRTPAFTSTVTSPAGAATFTGTQDQLAFVYRHHFGLPKRVPQGPWPSTQFDDRTTDTLVTLSTRRSGVPLVLWDDAEHDGDTISVLQNGQVVLDHYELSPKHHRIYLPLNWGDNTVLVVAHNLGRVPPNTARAYIRTGHGRVRLLVKTTTDRNAVVKLRYQ